MDEKQVQKMIEENMAYGVQKYGDTPTDALQLTPKKYVDKRYYKVKISSDGTAGTPGLPTGWTSVKNSTGNYTITHNLNTISVIPLVTSQQAYVMAVVTNVGVNSFDVLFNDRLGAATDSIFGFVLFT